MGLWESGNKSQKDKSHARLLNPHTLATGTSMLSEAQPGGCPRSVGQALSHLVLSLLQAPTKMSPQLQRFPWGRAGPETSRSGQPLNPVAPCVY